MGLPAIATDSGAAHEIITNDRSDGFLIPIGSAPELSIRLRDLDNRSRPTGKDGGGDAQAIRASPHVGAVDDHPSVNSCWKSLSKPVPEPDHYTAVRYLTAKATR